MSRVSSFESRRVLKCHSLQPHGSHIRLRRGQILRIGYTHSFYGREINNASWNQTTFIFNPIFNSTMTQLLEIIKQADHFFHIYILHSHEHTYLAMCSLFWKIWHEQMSYRGFKATMKETIILDDRIIIWMARGVQFGAGKRRLHLDDSNHDRSSIRIQGLD